MENILFDPKVRSKKKKKYLFKAYFYTEDESISFKEKLYTFLYNIHNTGVCQSYEFDWVERMMGINTIEYQKIESQFKIDFQEFTNSKNQ